MHFCGQVVLNGLVCLHLPASGSDHVSYEKNFEGSALSLLGRPKSVYSQLPIELSRF